MKQGLPDDGQGNGDAATWCDACAAAGESNGSFLITGPGEDGEFCENPSHGAAQSFDDDEDLE